MNSIDSRSLALQVADEVEHGALHGDVERRGDLVGDHDAGLPGQRPGQGDALALPAGQLPGQHRRAIGSRLTSSSSRATSPRRASRLGCAPRGIASVIDSPMLMRGSSDEYGSWNTICNCRLRDRRRTSVPASSTRPLLIGARPTAARARVDLPEPDSADQADDLSGRHGEADNRRRRSARCAGSRSGTLTASNARFAHGLPPATATSRTGCSVSVASGCQQATRCALPTGPVPGRHRGSARRRTGTAARTRSRPAAAPARAGARDDGQRGVPVGVQIGHGVEQRASVGMPRRGIQRGCG